MQSFQTVSDLTKSIKDLLENDQRFQYFTIKGELSNVKHHSRGHIYFTLKDSESQISAMMFQSVTAGLTFKPQEGDKVSVTGKLNLYVPSGAYSIHVTKMTKDGAGLLYEKMEQLRKELASKGYFDPKYKKPIPKYPKVIGVVTSPTGAVIEDIKNTVERRYPLAEIHLYPALVQGAGSVKSIKEQIEHANTDQKADVLIVGRGGGSIEDLWSFNELEVIIAIFESKIPIITAIGHETDHTISDDISDLRAPTPTAAAELATPNKYELIEKINEYEKVINNRLNYYLGEQESKLMHLDHRLDQSSPFQKLKQHQEKLDDYQNKLGLYFKNLLDFKEQKRISLTNQMRSPMTIIEKEVERQSHLKALLDKNFMSLFERKQSSFSNYTNQLKALNPLTYMEKGYAIIKTNDKVITKTKDINIDDQVTIELMDGYLQTKVLRKDIKHGK